ncbi:MAG: hypothetical protein CL681_27765 [Blastopirellula sp.]|nr:hypothetical protein [Blastopirellula sp.]
MHVAKCRDNRRVGWLVDDCQLGENLKFYGREELAVNRLVVVASPLPPGESRQSPPAAWFSDDAINDKFKSDR